MNSLNNISQDIFYILLKLRLNNIYDFYFKTNIEC